VSNAYVPVLHKEHTPTPEPQETTHVANQEAQIEKQLQDAWVKQATIYVVLMYKVQVRSCKNKLLLGVKGRQLLLGVVAP